MLGIDIVVVNKNNRNVIYTDDVAIGILSAKQCEKQCEKCEAAYSCLVV
jgi:hypothetical protein